LEGELRYLEALARCVGAPNPDVTARILEALLERGQVNAVSIANELEVSYPTALRSLDALMAAGIAIAFPERGKGRGRPRKAVALNRDGLLAAFDRCRALLEEGRKALETRLKEAPTPAAVAQQAAEAQAAPAQGESQQAK
jgi:predicted ArsR family transcriptional regulator